LLDHPVEGDLAPAQPAFEVGPPGRVGVAAEEDAVGEVDAVVGPAASPHSGHPGNRTRKFIGMASLAKRALRTLRPRFQHEVDAVVAPTYARADELAKAVDDIRRILSDQADAASEEAAVF